MPPVGTRPDFDGKRPPYRPDQPCYRQPLPDLNAANVGPPDGQGTPTGTPPDSNPGTGPSTPLPPLNDLPPLTDTVNTVTGAIPTLSASTRKRSSLAGELVSRLNPYRATKRKATRKQATRRSATR